MILFRPLLLASAVLVAAPLPAPASAQEPTVVIVVRHAERAGDPGSDPGLTEAGAARAQTLAQVLVDARVGAIITTQFRRTQLTAAPLAQAAGVTPVVIQAGRDTPTHAREIADAVRRFPGRTVLVVGHSNTVPAIVTALGGPAVGPLCDNEYGHLFTLVLEPGGRVNLIRARYGAEDGPPPADCQRPMR